MKKARILFILVLIILLLGLGYQVYGKYVLSKKISISFNTSDYYFVASVDKEQLTSFPTTINVTVKNNDGTNFTNTDLKYTLGIDDEEYTITAEGGNTRTITGGSKQEETFQVTIDKNTENLENEDIQIKFNITNPYIDEKVINIALATGYVWINDTNGNRTIDDKTATYKNPIIPVGFGAINTEDSIWNKENGEQSQWNNGLVIKNVTDGNEFVWVPVDGTNVTYERWCTNTISYENCEDVEPTHGLNMLDNITDYGGFWVARYEAGLPTTINQTTVNPQTRNVAGKPLSIAGAVPWSYIDWTTAKANSESMYANSYVQSGLVNGTQWDTIMKWLQNANYDVTSNSESWGNYLNSSVALREGNFAYVTTDGGTWTSATRTTSGLSQMIKTGASNNTKAKNIYDLAGNLYEWTDEYGTAYDNRPTIRGGASASSSPRSTAADCYVYAESTTSAGFTFRTQLYVKDSIKVAITTTKNDEQTATIKATATDNGAGVKKYDFYINDELKHTATTSDLTASYSFDYASTFGTTYNTYVVVTDNNNATSQSNISTVADYTISTKEDLEAFRDSVNNGNYYQNETIIQTADIDLEGSETNQWIPIGENEYSSYFNGTYEGNNHSISGIYINNDKTWQGLFKNIYTNGIVKNINLENGIINANDRSAGIAAGNSGQIIGCVNSCNIEGDYAGQAGIVAVNDGRIVNCYNTGSIVGNITDTFFEDIGGIASINTENGVVEGCYNIGNISVNATNDVYTRGCDAGGIVGQNGGIIRNCYNMGNMDVSLIHRVGGITGWNRGGTVCNCYNANTVIRGVTVGGIVGDNTTEIAGTVTNTYYLEGTATGGINGADVTGQAEVRTSAIMKTTEFKDLLGDEKWKIVQGVNSGYPILWWQTDEPQGTVLADVVTVGDYVNYDANSNGTYTFTSSDCLTGTSVSATISSADQFNSSTPSQWRVLNVDKENGTVELMSADPTAQTVTLSGGDGFVNAETVLNNVGAIYGHGKGATGGRSIKVEDVEQYSSYDKKTHENSYSSTGYFGGTKEYQSGKFYKETKDGNGNVTGYATTITEASETSPVTMTETYYYYTNQNYFKNTIAYNMIFKNAANTSNNKSTFWLSSRCVQLGDSTCGFRMRIIYEGGVRTEGLWYSGGTVGSNAYTVIPVISLISNVQTTGTDANGVWQLIVE